MNPSNFRYDINGLRGIAVIAVLIFHYNNHLLSGGFAGVDVFFVISGYLMTSIIFRGLQNQSFSFFEFYKARAKRIIPALLTICIILAFIGFFLFEPMTYKLVGKHILASLLFISDISYYNEAGYFDVDSQYKFLLHTWSLSVEWQFYLIYPIIISILYRLFKINTLKIILIVATITSFILSLYYTSFNPTFAFYMLPMRMWELLMGGIAYLYPISFSDKKRTIIEIFGLVIICLSFVFIINKSPWSGYFLFFPVFGAYCCILANNQKTILKNIIIQKIGLISYSLYLIHWPIIVFFKTIGEPLHFYIYLLLMFPLAISLYYFIERKRNYQYKTICLYLIILATGYFISIDGIGNRVKNQAYRLDYKNFFLQYYGGIGVPTEAKITHFNDNGQPPSLIITGDSHARQYGHFLIHNHINFIGMFDDGCMALPNLYIDAMQSPHDKTICPKTYKKLQTLLQKNPKANLVLIFRWDIYNSASLSYHDPHFPNKQNTIFAALPREIEQLIKIGGNQRQYFLVGQAFENYQEENIFQCYAKKQLFFYRKIMPISCNESIPQQKNPASLLLNTIAKHHQNVHFIDPTNVLCKNNYCALVDKNHNPILSDVDHLSTYGADIVGPYILNEIDIKKDQ